MSVMTAPAIPSGPSGAASPSVVLRSVTKRFGAGGRATTVVESLSLEAQPGEFVCLVGASGSGKSTLLNLLAGLDRPTAGSVELRGGRPALMFQEAALFPWLTVAENVEFPLRMSGVPRRERRDRISALLTMVHLESASRQRPHELSGGMRQRVALARALAQDTMVLLMDEPFGALDAMMRDRLHDELERIWNETKRTIVFVTHNVREAVRLGDRVLLLSGCPARISAEFDVAIARPRRIESPEVATLAASIIDRLRAEVGNDTGA